MERAESASTDSRHDLVWVVVLTAAFAVLCVSLELSEAVLAWTRPHERFQLDELPGVLLFLAIALTWYASRRVREARAALDLCRRAEGRLREALLTNRELAQANVRIQEEERRTLARELHDELGQCLNALKIDAVCLRDGASGGIAEVRCTAESIVSMAGHLEAVVRGMVRRLRPPGLDELGLAAAVESCVDGWRRRLPSVCFTLQVGEEIAGLDETVNITLYRLVQEALTNVAKHASASRVDIEMLHRRGEAPDANEVVLTVRDDGVGTRAAVEATGLGIVGMRERVEALAGRFDLMPAARGGFGFTARLPLRAASVA